MEGLSTPLRRQVYRNVSNATRSWSIWWALFRYLPVSTDQCLIFLLFFYHSLLQYMHLSLHYPFVMVLRKAASTGACWSTIKQRVCSMHYEIASSNYLVICNCCCVNCRYYWYSVTVVVWFLPQKVYFRAIEAFQLKRSASLMVSI